MRYFVGGGQLYRYNEETAYNGSFEAEAYTFRKDAERADIRQSKEKKEPKKRNFVSQIGLRPEGEIIINV